MSRVVFFSALGILSLAACSSGGTSNGTTGGTTTGGFTITIQHYAFSPDPLIVPAGSTITVMNNDTASTSTHTCTSEAVAGNYDAGLAPNGFLFDTGNIDAGTTATINVPAGIPSGTKQPYFCKQHTGMMKPADPVIQIQ